MTKEQKEKILKIFNANVHGVLSTTSSEGNPESALIGFGHTENLEIIFGCYGESRKYKNLQQNKKVAFVAGWVDDITIQYEGDARELSGFEKAKYLAIKIKKIPSSVKYSLLPNNHYFLVSPKWIRYLDLKNEEWEIYL